MAKQKQIRLAVNGGIGFGAKLSPKQLAVLGELLDPDQEIELTTLQQLIIEISEDEQETVKEQLKQVNLATYPVGPYVKSLRTCNFCKGSEAEGMPVAIELNKRIAGREVPFTITPAYTGCPNACGEPLLNDIGVVKIGDDYDLYIGGQSKGLDAKTGKMLKEKLTPDQLYESVDKVLAIYQENGKKREKFAKFVARYGFDSIQEELGLV